MRRISDGDREETGKVLAEALRTGSDLGMLLLCELIVFIGQVFAVPAIQISKTMLSAASRADQTMESLTIPLALAGVAV